MIVNSDERQWSWMDEGLNTFLQYLAEQEWEQDYPSQRGEPELIVPYMQSTNQVPIMTNSESIMQFGPNAYSKPATALNILRETILGRELFDFAFKEYARRWKFKRPMPADFFRTMEDATAKDLDWFWRGWFYTTDHCDIALDKIDVYMVDRRTPDEIAADEKNKKEAQLPTLSKKRNKELVKRADQFPELKDFYNQYDPRAVTDEQRAAYQKSLEQMTEHEKELLANTDRFYRLQFRNVGGLVMPIIVLLTLEDGSTKEVRIPAEAWRVDATVCDTLVITAQPVVKFELDPYRETADINRDNNHFPPVLEPTRFQLFKSQRRGSEDNPMSRAKRAEEAKEAQQAKEAKEAKEPSKEVPGKQSQAPDGGLEGKKPMEPAEAAAESSAAKKKQERKKKKRQLSPGV
jgi:hypothetical protein